MFKLIVFVVLILQLEFVLTFDDTTDDSVSLNFEDNVIDGKFSSFAKMNVRLSRQSNIELSPSRTISSLQYERFLEESRTNSYSYYTLRVHVKHRSTQDYVMTSVPMCLVLQAQFQYTTALFINENGYIIGVHVATKNSTCSPSNMSTLEKKDELNYKVAVRVQLNDIGPQPDTQPFLEKIKREQEVKLSSQENDNRPFILKYWKYLLPVVVIFVLQSAFTDAESGGR